MKKVLLVGGFAILLTGGLVLGFTSSPNESESIQVAQTLESEVAAKAVVYKSPTCGCCSGHADAMKAAGFDVEVIETQDMVSVKDKYDIPMELQSCHTTILSDGDSDYVVEGHVPIEGIQTLLAEAPDVPGIALPGMPTGTPGMPGPQTEPYDIMTLGENSELYLSL